MVDSLLEVIRSVLAYSELAQVVVIGLVIVVVVVLVVLVVLAVPIILVADFHYLMQPRQAPG